MKICIAGIGNPIRSDDGIGAYICEQIELLQIPGITTLPLQQLQVEQIEVFAGFDHPVPLHTDRISRSPLPRIPLCFISAMTFSGDNWNKTFNNDV
jgi:hypothetical protein